MTLFRTRARSAGEARCNRGLAVGSGAGDLGRRWLPTKMARSVHGRCPVYGRKESIARSIRHQKHWGRLATEVWLQERNFQQEARTKISVQDLVASLKACSRTQDLQRGKKLHAEAVECGHASNIYVISTLVRMYAKCGSIGDAHRVFDSTRNPDVVCWNALLLGYAENRKGILALELFSKMKANGCAPSSVTYIAALKACASLAVEGGGGGKESWLRRGKEIHSEIGSNLDLYVQNTLIDMYAKCGSTIDAHRVFDSIQNPDVVSWNNLLLGYVENGKGLLALDLFSSMKTSGYAPDSVTYVAALRACTTLAIDGDDSGKRNCLEWAKEIHSEISSNLSRYVQSTLIDLYAKCSSLDDAHRVFDSIRKPDVVCWNALISGYAENQEGLVSLSLFSRMKASGCAPSSVTYIAALKACTSLAVDEDGKKNCLERGREIHLEIGKHMDNYVHSRLIDMYAKCGSMLEARRVFNSMQKPDVVSWTALLSGYAENGEGLAALGTFSLMKASGCSPDSMAYVAALKACGLIGALARGRELHTEITEFSAHIVTCLVDFYAQCGSMVEAHKVFGLHPEARDITTWNALLAGYSRFGDSDSVFKLFEAMQGAGFRPDAVTFLCVLSCCSHAGLVEKAREYFEEMHVRHGITPTVMHYSCMVDVLGRANLLNEAVVLLHKMPRNPGPVTWMTLLAACRKWRNVEIGKVAFQSLVGEDEKLAAANVLMAHIYGSKGLWDEQGTALEARANVGASERPGQTYVLNEVGKTVKVVVGKQGPPEIEEKLQQFYKDMKEHGYDVSDAEKQEALCDRSERRAIVYGILKIPSPEPVRVFKDMRMSGAFHESTKMISKLSGRIIMVRDASRFHVMVNGNCSCGDYP